MTKIEKLAILLVQHADDLQLYANGVAVDALDEFEQTTDAIMELIYQIYAQLPDGLQLDEKTRRLIERLKKQIAEIRTDILFDEMDELVKQVDRSTRNEIRFWAAFFTALTGSKIAVEVDHWAKQIAENGIYSGGTIRQIFATFAQKDVDRLHQTIVDAVRRKASLGETRHLVWKAIRRTKVFLKSEIESIINGAMADVAMLVATENKGCLLFSSALDNRVCEECAELNGTIFPYDSPNVPSLPIHLNCRCRLIPIPAEESFHYLPLSAANFKTYFNQMTKDEQRERIGAHKQAMRLAKRYQLRDYESPLPEQRLTLKELKHRDQAGFARLKV